MRKSSKHLKIGFVLDDTLDTPDGVQQYVMRVGSWMEKHGYEVHYLVGESNRQDISNIHPLAKNIKVRFNKNRLSVPLPTSRKLIAKTLDSLKLDILHVQMPYSPLFAGRVINAAPPRTKLIGTFHIVPANWVHTTGARALELFNRRTVKQFDQIISVSPVAAEFAKTVFDIDSVVIPNAVDIKEFKHKPIKNKTLKIVFLGRLVERKGCQYLLKALVRLQTEYKGKYEVIIAGDGPLKPKLEQFAKKNKLKKVKFIGYFEENEKAPLLASADIAVFPSTGGESFGIVLIEAMASGSRVILGGNNKGYQGVLGDHPDLLFNPKDTIEFANRIQYFLEHEDMRKAAYKWSQANIKQYDISAVCKRIMAVYNKD